MENTEVLTADNTFVVVAPLHGGGYIGWGEFGMHPFHPFATCEVFHERAVAEQAAAAWDNAFVLTVVAAAAR